MLIKIARVVFVLAAVAAMRPAEVVAKTVPTPTPVPGATARPASAAEVALFRSFAPREGRLNGKPDPWVLSEHAVAGRYALIGFYNTNAGVSDFLVNTNGAWKKIVGGGGQITNNDMLIYVRGMSPTTAANLYALAVKQVDGQ